MVLTRSRAPRLLAAAVATAALSGAVALAPTPSQAEPTATATARTTGPTCGTKAIKKPGGGYWKCSFSDDFKGTSLNRNKWTVVKTSATGYRSSELDCFMDDPTNVRVAKGSLRLKTHKTTPFTCHYPGGEYSSSYSSGSVTTHGHFAQAFGRFEVRVSFPTTKRRGLQSAVWMLPAKLNYGPWPASGEIDIAELFTAYPDRLIPYIHYNEAGLDDQVTNNYCMVKDLGMFHRLVLIWSPEYLKVKYDGTTCLVNRWHSNVSLTNWRAPFDQPFNVLLTQALGILGNAFKAGSTPLPAVLKVDYVRVWK